MPEERVRLDQLLVDRGVVRGKGEAQSLIQGRRVRLGDTVLLKPGQAMERYVALEVDLPEITYASRGGIKLAAALKRFTPPIASAITMDVGASTGGFTDVLLRHGAARVYAIDVGYGQLAWPLQTDARVVVMDRTNIRYLQELPEVPQVATIDVAFISLDLVLPVVQRLLAGKGHVICLIKPQFEVGKGQVGKRGVVRDPAAHAAVLRRVLHNAQTAGWLLGGLIASPITGPAGNREFLAWLHHDTDLPTIDLENEIVGVTLGSHTTSP